MRPNIINVLILRTTKSNENWEKVKIITRAFLLINIVAITYYLIALCRFTFTIYHYLYVGVIVGRRNGPTVT